MLSLCNIVTAFQTAILLLIFELKLITSHIPSVNAARTI